MTDAEKEMPGAQSCRVHKLLEMLRFIALIALLLAAAAQEAQVQEVGAGAECRGAQKSTDADL